ncbi:uncharacterized protein LOC141905831 isoform X5 [Tubulanus polymorphus]|uniref:uncharacterized protein LOC141905831 isoform X5 n=1 Tax=Tubulanus polymorphus TaxID=672921 RepID=UPI003DA209C2
MDEYSLSKRQEPNVISGFEEDISSQCVPGTIGSSSPQDITDHEHLRKLKHENSSLTNENKLLKEKYNRATTRLQELEDLVVNLQQHLDQLLEDHSSELSSLRKKLRQEFEIERNDLNKKIHLLNQDNEQLGIELSSAKKQLEELHKVAQDSNILSEKESMITALKAEVHAYKDQLKKTENLYKESETHYHEELDRRKALASQVNKLTEMKNLLQQKVDERSEDTINEKQIKSLERRLKVTEDRLHLERADNGNKLSDVEEKLINENAKLQVQGKEFKRKWDREKSRAKHQELRVNELRDENEAMVISLANSPPSCYNAITEDGVIKRGRISLIIPEFKKNSSEFKDVMRQVEREEGLKAGQEAEIIHCLFYKKDEACKMLKNWEVQLHSLGLDRDNLSQGLKRLREEKHENDTKMQQREDEMEDLKMKSDEMENRLRGQISELVKEKHLVYAKLKTMEDRYAGMLSEMEVLRLSTSIGVQSCNLQRDYAAEAEIEKLKSELVTAQNESQQCTRSTKMMEGQLKAVKAELNAKAKELEIVSHKLHDAISEISTHSNEISNKHQDHVEKLYAQMRSSQGEVSFWQEKSFHLNAEKDELEEKIANLTRQIGFNQSKLQHEGRNMHTYELQKQGLERELAGKESQLLELTVKYNDLEDNLFHTRQNLLCEQDNSTKLATEVENLQIQLKLKNDLVDRFNGSDNDYGQGLQNMQQNLEAVHNELIEKTAEIHDEKVSRQKAQDDLVAVSKQFDNLKADYDVLCVSLEYEKNSAYKIKEHSDSVLKEHQNSLQELKKLQDELESCKTELNANIDMIVILKRDKESSYRDLQMMCHKLDEKDQTIITLQEKCSIAVESIQREYAVERTNLSNDIETKQSELQTTREKLVQITEQFKEKEIQLAGFGKTLRVLDEETRMRHDLELKYQSVNSELLDAKMLMGHMKTENVSLKEAARQLQDNMDKLKENNTSLREKLKDQHEKINQENHDLKNSIFKTNEQYDKERNDLKSRLNKALSSLKSAEASLSASNSSREQLLNNCRSSEQNLDELKGQLHEEITNRKLAEQLLSNMKVHLDDSIGQKNQYDDRLSVTQAMLMKKEGDLAVEQEKYQKLTLDFNELEATSYAQEARAQTLQEQVNGLEFENLNYRNTVESLKHNFTGKTKKQLEDMRQDVQSLEQERNKLMYQLQLLESDFMKAREQISQKNQEILNLKEENLVQDERLKDAKNKLREIKDARKLEEAVQGKLHLRNQELEKDIVSLRSNKGDMVDGSSIDSKSDVRDMLKELNRQVAEHNENRQRLELEYKQKLANLTKQYDSKINALELRLFSENAMHNVTKNQVNSLEEDLQRLRCKLLNKKRENTDKSKDVSRIEEINELIAKSQVRAQAMLSNSFALDETSLNNLRFSPMVGTPTALSPAFATSTPRVPSVNSMFRPIDSNK